MKEFKTKEEAEKFLNSIEVKHAGLCPFGWCSNYMFLGPEQ